MHASEQTRQSFLRLEEEFRAGGIRHPDLRLVMTDLPVGAMNAKRVADRQYGLNGGWAFSLKADLQCVWFFDGPLRRKRERGYPVPIIDRTRQEALERASLDFCHVAAAAGDIAKAAGWGDARGYLGWLQLAASKMVEAPAESLLGVPSVWPLTAMTIVEADRRGVHLSDAVAIEKSVLAAIEGHYWRVLDPWRISLALVVDLLDVGSPPSPPKDGPGEQGVFHYRGNTARMEPTPWRLLKHVWEHKRDTTVDAAIQEAWGYDGATLSTARVHATRANNALMGALPKAIPLSLSIRGPRILLQ